MGHSFDTTPLTEFTFYLLCEKMRKMEKNLRIYCRFIFSVCVLYVNHHLPMLVHVNRCVMEFCLAAQWSAAMWLHVYLPTYCCAP